MRALRATVVLVAVLQFVSLSHALHYPCELFECYLFQDESQYGYGEQKNDIPAALRKSGFTILSSFLDKAGLTANLSATGPFTLFAPTDDAFEELKDKAPVWFEQLSTNLPVLTSVMQGHVLTGALPSSDIPNLFAVTSASGEKIYFHSADKGLRMAVNGSRILGQRKVDNGIIYAIDKMIVEDIFEMLALMKGTTGADLTVMTKALIVSGVSKIIDFPGTGPVTMFVPNDEAFKALPDGVLKTLLANPDKLKAVVQNHIIYGSLFVSGKKLERKGSLKTLGGGRLPIAHTHNGLTVGKAKVIVPNRPGNNGVVHVIDKVLLPDY